MILKPAAMPYDLVTRSISAFGKEVPPRTHGVLDCDVTANARLPHWRFRARKARSRMISACLMVVGSRWPSETADLGAAGNSFSRRRRQGMPPLRPLPTASRKVSWGAESGHSNKAECRSLLGSTIDSFGRECRFVVPFLKEVSCALICMPDR